MARMQMDAAETVALGAFEIATADAYYELGVMNASGRHAAIDLVAAHKWFNVALSRGCSAAAARRAEIAREMSAGEIAEAQREARLWLTRH